MEFDEVLWLTAEDVREFNAVAFEPATPLGEYPDRPIDGPVANVQNLFAYGGWELDVVLIGCAYCHDITRAHSFYDGNKRTALMALTVFLALHGFDLCVPDDDWIVTIMLDVAAGNMNAYGLYEAIIDQVKLR